ncbi:MAG TPA: PilN domain-containing protein [Vicinamibacterales bacterium]|nr:PilN domain-containing protein [Vicinamibacterales bacterium]
MIRVNLLAVERERTRRRAIALQPQQKVALGCSLILVLTALGVGWRYWTVSQRLARADEEIQAAEQETRRLRSVLSQMQEFEMRRAQLQQRVALIEELRKGQTGPVRMLDAISRSLPDRLWLTQLEQRGPDVTLEGMSTTLTAISDFVAALEASGLFARPVEIVDSKLEREAAPGAVELVRFTLKARFGEAAPAAGAAARPPAAPAR